MKRIFIGICLITLFLYSYAFASWTVTLNTTTSPPVVYDWTNGQKLIVFRVDVTSDAGASGAQTLSTLIDTAYGPSSSIASSFKNYIAGSLFYALKWSHTGTVTAPTIVVLDGLGSQLLSYATATTGAGVKAGNADLSFNAPVTDLKFTSTTLGAAAVSRYEFWFIK
jgi:hypothetical protein